MVGMMLGNRYELLEKIGEGGTAVVYKSKCHLLNRYVAVKILKDEFASNEEFVEKFKREAAAAASLSDNNIVNTYDVGTQGNINYIVMEYVNGKTLKEIIEEEGIVGYKKAIDISIQIAKALDCAHKNNIIHRDIKPHNILVTNEGLVKVADFGIAKASNSVTITNTNKIMGSAHYFSPEQAKGSVVDCRTDIYSLGIVMYEMVTGKVPFDAESPVSVALMHIQEPIVPPKNLNGNIPDSLSDLIVKSMDKSPIKRYQSVKEMLKDLEKIKANNSVDVSNDMTSDYTRVMDVVKTKNNLEVFDEDEIDEDQDSDKLNDDDNSVNKSRKLKNRKLNKKKNIIIISAVIVVIIATLAIGFAYGVSNSDKSSVSTNKVTIPSIVGKKQQDAQNAVESLGLKFLVVGHEASDKPAGTVTACYPDEGKSVAANTQVRVTVSTGATGTTIPDIENDYDLATAKDMIVSAGYKVGKVDYDYSDDVPAGNIISQDPQPGSSAAKGDKINLVVSNGPKDGNKVSVPSVKGKDIDTAAGIINSANLKINKIPKIITDKSQDGIVISQNPGTSTKVKEGSTIDVVYGVYQPEQSVGYNYNSSDNNIFALALIK
ncbi:MAG: Stk1 family PASTA domain-containing Ser/Thr kinase [Bacillota bacterium]|nr:Stk1 family PASTA domain-containing Ser/Thr kinase [Bacillota bacterium]